MEKQSDTMPRKLIHKYNESEFECRGCGTILPRTLEFFYSKSDTPDGMTTKCKKCDAVRMGDWRKRNPSRVKELRKIANEKRKRDNPKYHSNYRKELITRLKNEVFSAYGNKCKCCGEDTFEFLTVDHRFGNGSSHREKSKRSSFKTINVLNDIIREGFPDTYQILCYNCHLAKDFYGKCPHGLVREYERQQNKRAG